MNETANSLSIFRILLYSFAFGFAFLLLTAALLWSLALVTWWRDGSEIIDPYYQGGFAYVGILAITSAAYFTSKLCPCRFMIALIIVAKRNDCY